MKDEEAVAEENTVAAFLFERKADRCLRNRKSLVLIRAVPILRMGDIVRSTGHRQIVNMKSTAGIPGQRSDTAEHGKESVISTHRSIRSVSCALNVE